LSILINKDTKVVITGITGKYGSIQAKNMKDYGTNVVAGVSPGKGGETIWDIPIYDTMKEVVAEHDVNACIVYVPAFRVKDAALEAMEAGIKLIMIPTEGLPSQDTMFLRAKALEMGVWILGPNTIGMISPGKCLFGSLASGYAIPGNVGILSRGGTIAIETIRMLSAEGIGQTTAVGAGGDAVLGKSTIDYLKLFEADPDTKAVVMLGEIGGQKENECAEFISKMTKKVYFYLLGRTAPKGAKMGHAGTIVGGATEGFDAKREILGKAGAIVVDTPWQLIEELKKNL
jgi:succinyl-CoA synthetase alpha subunit